MLEIVQNPHHYKPLRGDMHGTRRAHVGSFVLTFSMDETKQIVRFLTLEHHDDAYAKK
jgi:mRNA-degrading endonuclease RelE of RelBE toxin-antitoxin system